MRDIGIIGNGVVGSTLRDWFGDRVLVHDADPSRTIDHIEDVVECPWVFIAVNLTDNASTPHGMDVLRNYLGMMPSGTKVVIKTTIVPGTCYALQDIFPDLTIVYNPEFLTEAHAKEDFLHPHLQVVGDDFYGKGSDRYDWDRATAPELLSMLPKAPVSEIVSTRQAECLKHAVAGYLATKVSWFNQLKDAIGEDFDDVRDLMVQDPRIGASHTDINQDGYRGWGGKCFTKDVPLFAEITGMPIMKEVVSYNDKLRGVAKFDYWDTQIEARKKLGR